MQGKHLKKKNHFGKKSFINIKIIPYFIGDIFSNVKLLVKP